MGYLDRARQPKRVSPAEAAPAAPAAPTPPAAQAPAPPQDRTSARIRNLLYAKKGSAFAPTDDVLGRTSAGSTVEDEGKEVPAAVPVPPPEDRMSARLRRLLEPNTRSGHDPTTLFNERYGSNAQGHEAESSRTSADSKWDDEDEPSAPSPKPPPGNARASSRKPFGFGRMSRRSGRSPRGLKAGDAEGRSRWSRARGANEVNRVVRLLNPVSWSAFTGRESRASGVSPEPAPKPQATSSEVVTVANALDNVDSLLDDIRNRS